MWHPIVITTQLSPFTHPSLCARAGPSPQPRNPSQPRGIISFSLPLGSCLPPKDIEGEEKAGNRSETVRVMIYPGKGDIPHNPSLLRCFVLSKNARIL